MCSEYGNNHQFTTVNEEISKWGMGSTYQWQNGLVVEGANGEGCGINAGSVAGDTEEPAPYRCGRRGCHGVAGTLIRKEGSGDAENTFVFLLPTIGRHWHNEGHMVMATSV